MATIAQLQRELRAGRTALNRATSRAAMAVKLVLITGGAAAAGVAQFVTWKAGEAASTEQIVGIIACLAVFVGGLFVLFTEGDTSKLAGTAERALDAAQVADGYIDRLATFSHETKRLAETYQMCLTMRSAIERASTEAGLTREDLVKRMFELVERSVTIAAGFKTEDRWTVGVYVATPTSDPTRAELKCIAHSRAIKCEVGEARSWPEGVGIAGIAYANSREIIVPDLRVDGMQAIFGPRDKTRPYDSARYVSMVSVPIEVEGRAKPWGTVNATTDKAGHFAGKSAPGFKSDEPIRALANFIALAIAARDAQDISRVTGGHSPPPPPLSGGSGQP